MWPGFVSGPVSWEKWGEICYLVRALIREIFCWFSGFPPSTRTDISKFQLDQKREAACKSATQGLQPNLKLEPTILLTSDLNATASQGDEGTESENYAFKKVVKCSLATYFQKLFSFLKAYILRERSYILMLNLVLRTFPVPPYFTGTLSERGCLMLCTITRVSKREWTFFCRECCAYTDLHRRKLLPRVAAISKPGKML